MDTITHIVLGGCIGEVIAGKKLGKRSLLVGMLAQSVPDIDFVASFWQDGATELLGHRGITHSIVFSIFATIVLAFISKWYFRKRNIPLRTWLLLFGINIFTHISIDSFNAYGTGWLEPFNDVRVSLHTIFVADPLFTLWPLAAFLFLGLRPVAYRRRKHIAAVAISMSLLYLMYTNVNKLNIEKDVVAAIEEKKLNSTEYFTTASPFNSWLWFVAIRSGDGYYTGYHSVFDKDNKMELYFHPRNDSLLKEVKDQEELKKLIRFSEGFYTIEKWNDTLIFNVLRFGQVVGWHDPREKFAFHYILDIPGANELVTQRGRFERWNRETIGSFWRRIQGY